MRNPFLIARLVLFCESHTPFTCSGRVAHWIYDTTAILFELNVLNLGFAIWMLRAMTTAGPDGASSTRLKECTGADLRACRHPYRRTYIHNSERVFCVPISLRVSPFSTVLYAGS